MIKKDKIIVSWSGGKDSALALYKLKLSAKYEIAGLITTVNAHYRRVSIHGSRVALLRKQTASLGYAWEEIPVPRGCSNRDYERRMAAVLEKHKARGVSKVAFGDIFLEDLRRYRESKLALAGLKGLFPLWKKNTRRLAEEFIGLGFRAVTTCVDLKCLTAEFSGRQFDKDFLKQLPKGVDPCGENGEFHTFVYDGPIFRSKISYELGKSVIREKRFCFRDLVPHA